MYFIVFYISLLTIGNRNLQLVKNKELIKKNYNTLTSSYTLLLSFISLYCTIGVLLNFVIPFQRLSMIFLILV